MTTKVKTRQEEIREGLLGYLNEEEIQKILQYLHSKGCVLKVERELPTFYTSKMPTCEKGLECSFIEPIIEA